MKDGIMLAGNLIVDNLKTIDLYPEKLALAAVRSVSLSCGGVLNAVQAFARLDGDLPIRLVGCCGNDAGGAFIMKTLAAFPNVDTSRVRREGVTSFCDVMTEERSGQRTFFTFKGGSDASVTDADFTFENCGCSLLHFSYILLMDGMDAPCPDYGTELAKTFHRAQSAGLATSVDVVSEFGDRFRRLVPPALKYADYCTVNEFEAENITGVKLRDRATGALLPAHMEEACRALRALGVRRWATIHAPEGAFGLDENGVYTAAPSPNIPKSAIKGTVGAGDAFLAGLLYEAHRGGDHAAAMRMGGAVAGCSLLEQDSNSGIPPHDKALEIYDAYGLAPSQKEY